MTTATAPQLTTVVDRGILATALKNLACVIPARTPKPILSCVKLTARDGTLNIFSTNLELFATVDIGQVDVQADGTVCVSAEKLTAIVSNSADPTITLELSEAGDFLTVRDSTSRYKLPTMDPAEMPPMRLAEDGATVTLEPGTFSAAMNKVTFATANETSRYAINGVLVTLNGKRLDVVATDGRRLAIASMPAKLDGELADFILPTSAIQAVQRIIGDGDAITVTVGEGNAIFKADGATVATSLVEGNFPPYKDILPKDHDKAAKVGAEILASLVRRASILTSEESKGVRFAFKGDKLTLNTRAPEIGESEMSCAIAYEGEPLDVGFNPRFVAEGLKACGALDVTLKLTNEKKPLTMLADGFVYVVMPVSLG